MYLLFTDCIIGFRRTDLVVGLMEGYNNVWPRTYYTDELHVVSHT
jgi:hypothetical protein